MKITQEYSTAYEIDAEENTVIIGFRDAGNLYLKLEMTYEEFQDFLGDLNALHEDTKDVE